MIISRISHESSPRWDSCLGIHHRIWLLSARRLESKKKATHCASGLGATTGKVLCRDLEPVHFGFHLEHPAFSKPVQAPYPAQRLRAIGRVLCSCTNVLFCVFQKVRLAHLAEVPSWLRPLRYFRTAHIQARHRRRTCASYARGWFVNVACGEWFSRTATRDLALITGREFFQMLGNI